MYVKNPLIKNVSGIMVLHLPLHLPLVQLLVQVLLLRVLLLQVLRLPQVQLLGL